MTPLKYRFCNLSYTFQGVTFVAIVTLPRMRAHNFTERVGVTGWFSNWTRTSVDNDAHKPNNWLDQWQSGKASMKCTFRNMSRWCGVVLHNVSTKLSRKPIPFNLILFLILQIVSFTCITPLDISVPNTFIIFSPAAQSKVKKNSVIK